MKFQKQSGHVVDFLFTLSLFGVFTICALIVAAIGVQVYQYTVSNMENNYTVRTSLTYVAEKIRQHDEAGGVRIGQIGGAEALLLNEEYDGVAYTTYIYAWEQELHELFIREDREAKPEDGQSVMPVTYFSVTEPVSGTFLLSCKGQSGERMQMYVSLHSEEPDHGKE